jgi:hypothetical protein
MVTIYRNIFDKQPNYISVDSALDRIKQGKSKIRVEEIRSALDKDKANALKGQLPSVCFSGKFETRTDDGLLEHSGYIILDFDQVMDCEQMKHDMISKEYVKATWISPSGNGVKALVLIADKTKHREHFQSLLEDFPLIDKSGINISRVCYESFDEDIFIQDNVKPYKKYKTIERVKEITQQSDEGKIFDNILKWLTNKGDAFVSGERNVFIFKLASACCRFGLDELNTGHYIHNSVLLNDTSFTSNEANQTIKSAYRSNKHLFGSAVFENEKLIEKTNKREVIIDPVIYDTSVKPKDVVFGEDVKGDALNIYDVGYEGATTTEIAELDRFWKWKRGEITLLSGIGNYGKSTFLKYILLVKSMKVGWKWGLFAPEDFPAHEFYHDLVEIMLGMDMTPANFYRPKKVIYEMMYDWVSKHFFFVYPNDIKSTPTYIKERFLELIIKEKIDGCIIDPFNQLDNDYASVGGRDDKYLEVVLADFKRFAQDNNTHFLIVAHPKGGIKKDGRGNYECPDVFDLSGGAMWNNKMDNILIYHRPYRGEDATLTNASLHSKKIKRQKIVGSIGQLDFNLKRGTRRYIFDSGVDYIETIQSEIKEQVKQQQMFDDVPF